MIKLANIIKEIINDGMFPKGYNRHWNPAGGLCGETIYLVTKYLLSKKIKNFKVYAGWWTPPNSKKTGECDVDHAWIVFDDGRVYDPTKKQWQIGWGIKNLNKVKYDVEKIYTPNEFIKWYKS